MFLMTSILFGSFLAVLPIVVHLLHRQRSTPVQWGAMQFLLDTTIQQRKRKNIDHWLLLLLRMVAIVIMALLLARPLLPTGKYNPFAGTTSSDITIVIDHSLSMGRRSQDRTLFDHSIDVVDKVIDSLHPTDTLSIVLAEHTAKNFTEHPISNASSTAHDELTQLRQALRQVRPGTTDCSIPLAVQAARDLANSGRNLRKLVIVLTDEQRSNWHAADDHAWRAALGDRDSGPDKDLAVYTIAIPPGGIVGSSCNLAVANLNISPALIGINRTFDISATILNTGPGDLTIPAPIQLTVDGKQVARGTIAALAANESATVHFDDILTDPGSHWVKVSAEIVDGLDADNAAYAPVDAIDRLPVLIVDGDLAGIEGFRASRFLSAALTPTEAGVGGALITTHTVSPADATRELLSQYPVIILNDVPRLSTDLTSKLIDYVQSGHGLWIILGPRSDPAYLATLAKTPLLPLAINGQQVLKANDHATVDPKEPDHPTLFLLTSAQVNSNPFTGTNISTWWNVTPALVPDSAATNLRTLLAVNHNDVSQPLVLTHDVGGSGGRVIIWTSNVDSDWNNFPLVTNFVPLVQETILYLSSGLATAKNRRLDSGQPLIWSTDGTPAINAMTITQPDGATKKAQPILTNGKYVLNYSDTVLPGLYAMHFEPATLPQPIYFTVNIDKAELDPAVLSDADVDWFKTHKYLQDRITVDGLDKALGIENRGTEVWPYAALFLLVLLVIETAMTWRVARLQTGEGVL